MQNRVPNSNKADIYVESRISNQEDKTKREISVEY